MRKTKYILAGFFLLVLSVLFINSVYALAVSSPYWPDNPLVLSPGDTADLQLVLKNSAGATPLTVSAQIVAGSEIAQIVDPTSNYILPAGGSATVSVRVNVPLDSRLGGSYAVKFSFKTVGSSQGGTVGIESAIDTTLPVFIVKKEGPKFDVSNTTLYLVIAIAILILAIVFVKRNKK